ncbi:hypothetical protein VE03_09297, partial [Pseudogymnoascus sp. 23342-1-I1]
MTYMPDSSYMTSMSPDERLYKCYDEEECTAAICGKKVPRALGSPTTRICIIRGIRYYPGFATELYSKSEEYPEFMRALNARSIMSGTTSRRELAQRYPQMRYHVGRACAAGGYTELFNELGLLPEISIAEEARDNQESGSAIFDTIVAGPVKYSVMDDYELVVELSNPIPGACLNGDTAKYDFYFNITEDEHVDNDNSEHEGTPDTEVVQYLYTPLPADLPHINKDILILQAAYEGNVDRYFRLRRRDMLNGELQCVMRGIFHNTMFAKWWSLQPEIKTRFSSTIRRTINARFIMNNDLSRITDDTPDNDLPYNIYYPSWPTPKTLEELHRRKPCMAPQVTRACILADEQDLYDQIKVDPDRFLLHEARSSPNPLYLADILHRAPGIEDSPDDSSEYGDDPFDWSFIYGRTKLRHRMTG